MSPLNPPSSFHSFYTRSQGEETLFSLCFPSSLLSSPSPPSPRRPPPGKLKRVLPPSPFPLHRNPVLKLASSLPLSCKATLTRLFKGSANASAHIVACFHIVPVLCIPPPCPLFLSAQRCKKWALWVGHGGKGSGWSATCRDLGGGLLKPCPKCRPGRDGYMSAVYSTYCVRVRGCGIDHMLLFPK